MREPTVCRNASGVHEGSILIHHSATGHFRSNALKHLPQRHLAAKVEALPGGELPAFMLLTVT